MGTETPSYGYSPHQNLVHTCRGWSARLVRTPTASRWAPDSSGSDKRVNSVPHEPDVRGKHVSLGYAAHEADSDDDYAEQDDYTVKKVLARPECLGAWRHGVQGALERLWALP